MYFTSLKIIIFMWQCGFVDTFTAVNFIYNIGAQYGGIVIGAMAEGNVTKLPRIMFEPFAGFGVSYQFVRAAKTVAERRFRIATLAALLSTCGATSVGSNPATNAALGAAVANHIGHMRNVLEIRGGSMLASEVKDFKIGLDLVETPILTVHPYRAKFTANSKVIIDNIFREHTAHRYVHGSTQKIKILTPTYLTSIASVSTQINTTRVIGWTCFGLGLIGFVTFGSLYLFQRVERKRWETKNNEIIIDVTASQFSD